MTDATPTPTVQAPPPPRLALPTQQAKAVRIAKLEARVGELERNLGEVAVVLHHVAQILDHVLVTKGVCSREELDELERNGPPGQESAEHGEADPA